MKLHDLGLPVTAATDADELCNMETFEPRRL